MMEEPNGSTFEEILRSNNKHEIDVKKNILESSGIVCRIKKETQDKTASAWGMPMGMEGLVHTFILQVDQLKRDTALDILASASVEESFNIVLLDREHKILTVQNRLPDGSIDSAADPRGFLFTGEHQADDCVYQFFLTQRKTEKIRTIREDASWVSLRDMISKIGKAGASVPPAFRDAYCSVLLGGYSPPSEIFGAFFFGSTPLMADRLAKVVTRGNKRATAGLLKSYEAENEALPVKDDIWVILDGGGKAAAVIRTEEVLTLPFREVNAGMAAEEGEGNLSLRYWRKVHRKSFTRECRTLGIDFSENLKVVFERFELLKTL